MDANRLLGQLGHPGNYAKLVFFFMCLNYFPVAFNHLAMSVFGATPPHRCTLPDGTEYNNLTVPTLDSGKLDSCNVYVNYSHESGETVPCPHGWTYSPYISALIGGPDEDTVVMEWDLVCSERWWVSLSTSLYFAGVMVGGVIFGAASDSLGRFPVIVFCLFIPVILGVMLYFVESFVLFIIIRLLIGVCMQGLQTCSYVLGMELFPDDRHRAYTTALYETTWSVGVMALALLAWTIKAWRWISLAFALLSVLSLLYVWAMPESLRWMYNKRKFARCQDYLIKAAKYNKVTLDPRLTTDLASVAPPPPVERRRYTIIDMFRTPSLRRRSCIMFYVWFATSCGYYGLSLNASRLAGDKYLNFFISGAIEFPAYFAGIWILSRFGRRIPLSVYFFIGGAALIIAASIPKEMSNGTSIAWLSTLLAWIGKFSTAGCWSVIFLYASELYPTLIRNVAVGSCAFCARVGSLVAPQILLLGQETKPWVPFVILGIIALLGSLVTLALPETMGKSLPDTIEQADALSNETAHSKGNGVHGDGMDNGGYVTEKPAVYDTAL